MIPYEKKSELLLVRANIGICGGIETQIVEIARAIKARGRLVPVLATTPGPNPLADRFRALGMSVELVPFKQQSGILPSIRSLIEVVRRRPVALVQSHAFRESIAARGVRAIAGIPHVYRAHTYINCSNISSVAKANYHALAWSTQPFVDHYAAITSNVRDELSARSHVVRSRISVIPDGVTGLATQESIATTYPLSHHLACVANIIPGKGHEDLIKAISELRVRGRELRVTCLGSALTSSPRPDDYLQSLRFLARSLGVDGQIEFPGWSNDIVRDTESMPVLVLPSHSESLPNSILEAMGQGKIVLSSAVGSIPQFLRNGTNGYLHEPGDYKMLANQLDCIFTADECDISRVRQAAWMTWKQQFSIEHTADELCSLYESLLGGSKPI